MQEADQMDVPAPETIQCCGKETAVEAGGSPSRYKVGKDRAKESGNQLPGSCLAPLENHTADAQLGKRGKGTGWAG